jgi:flagellar motor switch protein FliN
MAATSTLLPVGTSESRVQGGQEFEQAEGALVPAESDETESALSLRPPFSRLPVELEVSIPIHEFRVRDLVRLVKGLVIETRWSPDDDLPLLAGEVQLAWMEFEVLDTRLAVRITRLA